MENTFERLTLSETLQLEAGGARPGGNRGCTGRALLLKCARIALITAGSSAGAFRGRDLPRAFPRAYDSDWVEYNEFLDCGLETYQAYQRGEIGQK